MTSSDPSPATPKAPGLSKRLGGLVTTGGIPATIVSFTGDLFTPKGGWILVGVLGVLALVIGGYLLLSLQHREENEMPWWYRMISSDSELGWAWKAETPIFAHGIHVIFLFGVVCLFSAQKSFAAAAEGGVLAGKVDAVAVAQRQLGISEQILAEQKKTNAALESLNKAAEGSKREISANPRIQLADKGVMWEAFRLTEAIKTQDKSTVALFLEGEMPIAVGDAWAGFKSPNGEIKKLLLSHSRLFNPADCKSFVGGLDASAVNQADELSAELVRTFCRNDVARSYVAQELEKQQKFMDRQMAAYNEALARQQTPEACMQHELRDGGRPLMQEASLFNPMAYTTMGPRQQMLAALNAKLITGRVGDVRPEVRKYCDRQANATPNISTDDTHLQKWKRLQRWVG